MEDHIILFIDRRRSLPDDASNVLCFGWSETLQQDRPRHSAEPRHPMPTIVLRHHSGRPNFEPIFGRPFADRHVPDSILVSGLSTGDRLARADCYCVDQHSLLLVCRTSCSGGLFHHPHRFPTIISKPHATEFDGSFACHFFVLPNPVGSWSHHPSELQPAGSLEETIPQGSRPLDHTHCSLQRRKELEPALHFTCVIVLHGRRCDSWMEFHEQRSTWCLNHSRCHLLSNSRIHRIQRPRLGREDDDV
ncbi:hypothetical protein BLNAU_388 [Blattamonas nauphoetae]|uniref:Uncharacterized protein n=1 Tax=Blattamonas nauphoetae TaxID=2049346 RepID=A0ABQ9YL32_9EUKA|nr:hypothetical protein BLNAU_388 [Blattamonas nauphoetae]